MLQFGCNKKLFLLNFPIETKYNLNQIYSKKNFYKFKQYYFLTREDEDDFWG